MNKCLLIILIVYCQISCRHESNYELRKLFVEYKNIPEDIQSQIEISVLNKRDTIYNWGKTDHGKESIIYEYYPANQLPKSNLLDGTRKICLSLLDQKDSIGNPMYQVELYKSEQSQWKRSWNLGSTPFYSDTIVSNRYIGQIFSSWLNISQWKGLP